MRSIHTTVLLFSFLQPIHATVSQAYLICWWSRISQFCLYEFWLFAVLVGILEPKRKIQAYSALQMFHSIGYLLSGCVSTYLCMNTKLYILLASVILAQVQNSCTT